MTTTTALNTIVSILRESVNHREQLRRKRALTLCDSHAAAPAPDLQYQLTDALRKLAIDQGLCKSTLINAAGMIPTAAATKQRLN